MPQMHVSSGTIKEKLFYYVVFDGKIKEMKESINKSGKNRSKKCNLFEGQIGMKNLCS